MFGWNTWGDYCTDDVAGQDALNMGALFENLIEVPPPPVTKSIFRPYYLQEGINQKGRPQCLAMREMGDVSLVGKTTNPFLFYSFEELRYHDQEKGIVGPTDFVRCRDPPVVCHAPASHSMSDHLASLFEEFDLLIPDVMPHLLQYVDQRSALSFRLVSRKWNAAVQHWLGSFVFPANRPFFRLSALASAFDSVRRLTISAGAGPPLGRVECSAIVEALPRLLSLSLNGQALTVEGARVLSGLQSLREIYIRQISKDSPFQFSHTVPLQLPSLEKIIIAGPAHRWQSLFEMASPTYLCLHPMSVPTVLPLLRDGVLRELVIGHDLSTRDTKVDVRGLDVSVDASMPGLSGAEMHSVVVPGLEMRTSVLRGVETLRIVSAALHLDELSARLLFCGMPRLRNLQLHECWRDGGAARTAHSKPHVIAVALLQSVPRELETLRITLPVHADVIGALGQLTALRALWVDFVDPVASGSFLAPLTALTGLTILRLQFASARSGRSRRLLRAVPDAPLPAIALPVFTAHAADEYADREKQKVCRADEPPVR